MPIITLSNGNEFRFEKPISPLSIIHNMNSGLFKYCIAAQVNEKLVDLVDLITFDSKLNFIMTYDSIGLKIIRHSCSHLLGYAIKQLWPKSKMIKGSIIDNDFYYDIDLDNHLTSSDLTKLEKTMQLLASKGYDIVKQCVSWNQAIELFQKRGEVYKVSILNSKIDNQNMIKYIKLYIHEQYIDMCQGPHVPNISFCKYFKLHTISNVYYSEFDEKKVLQRILGTTWVHNNKSSNLSSYSEQLSQSCKNRDHRDIAHQLDLYHKQDNAPGMVFWHKNGWIVFQELKKFIRKKLKEYQYQEVKSPIMFDRLLWEKTGHWDNYYKHMFTTASENREYCIKPMNCPGHVQIFNHTIKSYKDLPIRIAEFGHCHRNEPSGSLHGLMRIREFTQDDAHIFCSTDQIQDELDHCIKMMYDIYNIFGFKKIIVKLSTRPKNRIGSDSVWNMAEEHLSNVLKRNNISFILQPNDGAFYGPKIEFVLLDSLKRSWQCGTVQLDFSLPNKLGAKYVDSNNKYQVPVMIHRAVLGSIERFIGLLIEEYVGFFPTWLSPVQVVLMSITSDQSSYVKDLSSKLIYENIRIETDLSNEKIGFKIRLHTVNRVPYMIVCGNSEMNQGTISIRTFRGKKINNCNINLFLEKLKNEIYNFSFNQWEG